ncbi:unnamed protein product [Vitrella brassicaformis CCMP3155]|uniref:Uncharacterized protein n=1 Tax=Vitrella brassicaformis (strain CCMP3155) TaxID=1169540 RepID=A0A0G4GBV1_VITBC|nr:unnamed protein product [Vitrella brassicaformis CCMP3155]|eukprot:CEM26317.1 unnamed protein product [Vitrella brassicaformis CCMP3155]
MEPDGILTTLRALATAIHRLAGVGISAADTHVTAVPEASWNDYILASVVNQTRQQVDSVAAVRSSSSAAAACEPAVGGGRKASLFPNMVPRDDHGDDASGEADKKPTKRPFQLLVLTPASFDQQLLRLELTSSDVLAKKIIREMARAAESMVVETVSSAAPAADRGSFRDYVFESLSLLTIEESVDIPDAVLPSLPATPYSRFPRLKTVCFEVPSIHLIRQGGVRELLAPIKGQLEKIIVALTDVPSGYDTSYGTGQPPPREAAPGLLAQLTLECLDTIGHVDQVVLIFMPDDDDIKAFLPQMSPLYHLFTTPNLAARLPPIRQLIINTPYCVHDRFGDVRLEFITAVTDNTRGPQRVIFSEGYTQELLSPHLLRQSPAYLSSAAVDEALASAGSPFVVVKSDDNTLTVGR